MNTKLPVIAVFVTKHFPDQAYYKSTTSISIKVYKKKGQSSDCVGFVNLNAPLLQLLESIWSLSMGTRPFIVIFVTINFSLKRAFNYTNKTMT